MSRPASRKPSIAQVGADPAGRVGSIELLGGGIGSVAVPVVLLPAILPEEVVPVNCQLVRMVLRVGRSTHATNHNQEGRWSIGSATDAVADVCGLRRVDHPNNLQLEAHRQHLEQPTVTTEQHLVSGPVCESPAVPHVSPRIRTP